MKVKNLNQKLKLLSPSQTKELRKQLNILSQQSWQETNENCSGEVYRLAQVKCMEDYISAHESFIYAHEKFLKTGVK